MNQKQNIILVDLSGDITFEYMSRVRYHDDEIGIVLKGHLFCEYLLNRIGDVQLNNKNKQQTFAKKLLSLRSAGLIPEYLYMNLRRLNQYRNQLAHTLNWGFDNNDMIIMNSNGKEKCLKKSRHRYLARRYLKMLSFTCLSQLRSHMVRKLNVDPRYLA